MIELILDFSSFSTFYMVYTGMLLSLVLVCLIYIGNEYTIVDSPSLSYQGVKQSGLTSQLNTLLIVNPVIIWLYKSAKKYQFSDQDSEDSISSLYF